MQHYGFENQKDIQLSETSFSRTEKKQIEQEIMKRLRTQMLMLGWIIIPIVALAVWFLKPQPAVQNSAAKLAATTVLAKKIEKRTPPTSNLAITATTTTNPTTFQKEATDTIFFVGVGDMAFNGQIGDTLRDKGAQDIFSDITQVLQSGDVVVGDLESPLSPGSQTPGSNKSAVLGAPEAATGMKNAGINLVSLANDHMMDYGTAGLIDTITRLNRAGIAHAGAGSNSQQAYTRTVLTIKGKKVAFLALSSIAPDNARAQEDKAGIAANKRRSYIDSLIKESARQNDYLIVSCHWGDEGSTEIMSSQRKFAKRAIDAGADVVIGSHPHIMQGIEIYNGRCIAYSPGNFIYPSGSGNSGQAFVLKLSLAKGMIIKAEVIPISVDPSGKPSLATGCAAGAILQKLKDLSDPLATNVNIVGNTAQVT
ncbi:MAG: CapA family protein [Candidatus Aquicultor sp.]